VIEASERIVVPAGRGRARQVPRGASIVVETPSGSQVGDLFAFRTDDPREFLSPGHTRVWNGRLFPAVGEPFVSNRRRPLLTLIDDSSPGVHDMLIPACDPERYRQLGVVGWHANCAENLRNAVAGLGVSFADPLAPINVFMEVVLHDDGGLELGVSPARAGDRLALRAEERLVVALSACPQDLLPISAGGPTDLVLEVGRQPLTGHRGGSTV
jgi:uncharacterized protein YcgI (DUF1989 family)